MLSFVNTAILIPTYNEVGNIGKILKEIAAIAPSARVYVLDDNSPDGTGEIVKQVATTHPSVRLISRRGPRGFARSYIEGLNLVASDETIDAVIMMDADFSHDPKEIPRLIELLERGADIVLGSRYALNQSFPGIPRWRRHLSRFANKYVQALLRLPTSDCTSGFIAMHRRCIARLQPATTHAEGYGFLVELKYRARQGKLKIVEHPVEWPNRHQGKSKMSKKIILESVLLPWRILLGNLASRTKPAKSETQAGAR